MADEFFDIINLLQSGQTPPVESPNQVSMGLQSEERGQDFGMTRMTFGFQSVNESGNMGEK